jgi:hypothetical protein
VQYYSDSRILLGLSGRALGAKVDRDADGHDDVEMRHMPSILSSKDSSCGERC